MISRVHPESVLFVTLDSCRYDTFAGAATPNLASVAPALRAMAPGHFTYGSHAAMFVGFTPGRADLEEPFVNPKQAKIFRMVGAGLHSSGRDFACLEGTGVVDGFNRLGYRSIGTGAVGWFDPALPTGRLLSSDFHSFFFPPVVFGLSHQLRFIRAELEEHPGARVFLFLNIGETHVPYYYEGAPWDSTRNPCVPFGSTNDADECRMRQTACLEYVDRQLGPLLDLFGDANVLVCADHGDAWGEDGVWEHGISHPKVLEVPLLFRLPHPPSPLAR